MRAQQIARDDRRLADSQREALCFHAVCDAEDALLEQLALRLVRFLGGVGRDGAGLLGERKIGIAGLVGRLHGAIAGQRSRDAELLLRPVDVGDAVAGRRLDQAAQPDARAENEFRVARLVAARAAPEGGQDRAVAAVAADGEIVEPQSESALRNSRSGDTCG